MNKLNFFKFILLFSLIGLIIFLYLFFNYFYNVIENNSASENLAKSYSVSYLYSNNPLYSAISSNSGELLSASFVVGIIKIDKLKLNYPILYKSSEELLKIAPCRFAGPMPNEIGNLCIAGHNYIDNTFFAKISELNIDDEICIYGLDGSFVRYYVFDKREVSPSDFSCTSQETNGKRVVTLMTCNTLKQTRILVVAKEK